MPANVFFNELHYDNAGADANEGFEVAGVAGTDLTGWRAVLYNGGNGQSYDTVNLSGVIPDLQNGFGTLSFLRAGIQNGSPDGIALIDAAGAVVQFLSYEGVFTATNGPASGVASTDIGVVEAGTEAAGLSLQLKGSGTTAADFAWTAPTAASLGAVNAGQSFAGPAVANGVLSIADASVAEGNDGTTAISFTVTRANGDDGAVSATYAVTFGTGGGQADAADFASGFAATGSVQFADGQTTATVTLPVQGDAAFEADEAFTVTLSAPQGGATLGDAVATGTIRNDDAAPPAPPANVFINEIHYDNAGTDVGEAIEVAGAAGTDLTGWSLVLYNGNGGGAYATIALGGVIDDEGNGFGAVAVAAPAGGIQNGSPDGVALVDATGRILQFLSYEGVFTATAGPATGLTSVDIGVAEEPAVAVGFSLQLKGRGSTAADFEWTAASDDSFGAVNTGQEFLSATGTGELSVRDASVAEGDAGTTALTFTVRRAGGTANAATVDYAVAFGTADLGDLVPGAALAGTVAFAAGESTRTITLDVQGDTVGERNETLTVTLGATTGDVVVVDGGATGTIVNDDPLALSIPEIQGRGHQSAFVGQVVRTTGIVTAVDTNGFYLQDPAGDGDDATSDGVFVFTGGAPGVQVGDGVAVRGTVGEFQAAATGLSVTQIGGSPIVTVDSVGNALPAAVLIGVGGRRPPTETIDDDAFASFDPATDGIDFYESLEGMRVTIDRPQAVSNTNAFGETDVVASLGEGATGVNARGGITVSASPAEPQGDFNPEKIQIDDDAGVFAGFTPGFSIGDRLGSVTGVVNYSFDNYEVVVTEAVAVTRDATLPRERTDLVGTAADLTIATYNVENLDPGDAKFDILAGDIVFNLRAPDILAVQEIQDADGAGQGADLSGVPTAQKLIDAIAAAGGPRYGYVEVAPATPNSTGGEPGGNIRSGYFYNLDRVGYVDGSAQLITGAAYNGTRKPLVAQFTFAGETVTAINVHLTSRLGSEPLFGDAQPPQNAGDAARTAQAAGVKAFVNDRLATDPSLNFVVLGDWNGFYFERAQTQLTDPAQGGVFTNANALVPEEERYSFVFAGNSQALDNILLTGGLLDGAAFDAVHINAEYEFVPGVVRATDHDPQLVRLRLAEAPTAGDDAVAVDEDATTADLYATLLANDGGGASITAVDTAATLGTVVFDPAARTLRYVADDDAFDRLSPGETLVDRFTYTVTSAQGLTDTATVEVTVTGVSDGVTRTGSARNETLTGTADEDSLSGLGGVDNLFGLGGDDRLFGGAAFDRLFGGDGDDRLFGEMDSDVLDGGAGDDLLFGGAGGDNLTGGAGADRFYFGANGGQDTVFDFAAAQDVVVLQDGVRVTRFDRVDFDRDGALDTIMRLTGNTIVRFAGVSDPSTIRIESEAVAASMSSDAADAAWTGFLRHEPALL